MGGLVRALTRRNLIAIAVGVVLAGAPLLAFNLWLNGLADRQGQEEIDTSAKRAIALAESRVNRTVYALNRLAAEGVNSCRPSDVEADAQSGFRYRADQGDFPRLPPTGRPSAAISICRSATAKSLSSEMLLGAEGYTLDIIRLGDGERMVRLRRQVGDGPYGLAALVPTVLFLPQVSTQGEPFNAHASIVTREGASIGVTGYRAADAAGRFLAKDRSNKYGFNLEISMARSRILAAHADLKRLGLIVTSGIVLALVAFALLLPRRTPDNPIAEMQRALEAGEFVPYYQPIVDICSGQLHGAEVLVRWRKPDGTLVSPGSFIPLAETSGLILDMTRDLMRRVCAEAGEAVGRRPGMKISFNFAGKLFSDESIVKDVRNIFSGSPIKFSQVVLEVTERDPIEDLTETRQIIAALQGLGVRIAMDDVGTGHSGLSYMLKLGVDIIKIDKMFVDAIGTDRNSTTIVETLIDLAHNMRMDVVAEGVETFEQVEHLRELGIRMAQGFVFAPPLPGRSFLELMEAIDPLPTQAEESVAIPLMKKGGLAAAQV